MRKKWYMLMLGCVLFLFIAVLYAWSVFVSPLEQEFGWGRIETSGIFTLSICTFCVGSILAGLLFSRLKGKWLLRIGAVCMLCGFGLSAAGNSLALLYVGYGILCGLGVGICYNTILTCCNTWFFSRRGLCNGILLMVYGFGAMLISIVAERLIHLGNWRLVFWLLGGIEAAVLMIGSFFLHAHGMLRKAEKPTDNDISPLRMLKTTSFYKAFVWLIIISACGLATIGNAAPIAMGIGLETKLASVLTGSISAAGGFGRLAFGRAFDLTGHKTTMMLNTVFCIIALFFIIGALYLSVMFLLFVGFLFLGLGFGGMACISTVLVRDLYGLKYYSKNLSIMGLQLLPASLLGPLLSGTVYNMNGSYMGTFFILLILCLIAMYLAYTIKRIFR